LGAGLEIPPHPSKRKAGGIKRVNQVRSPGEKHNARPDGKPGQAVRYGGANLTEDRKGCEAPPPPGASRHEGMGAFLYKPPLYYPFIAMD
jgi:hypothetical protein